MLLNVKSLTGYKLECINGEIGTVKEFYFDDKHWTIRYLVVDTGSWLESRKVLISPYALVRVMKEEQRITVSLTKKQIEDSPSLDSDKPVSRQFEESYYGFYGWPIYSGGPYMWGAYPYIVRDRAKWKECIKAEKPWDPNLRSTFDVSGHYIQAADGEIGHVEDFIIDDEYWTIRYLIVNTKNWWPGKKVLISPQWIDNISWGESKVFVNLTREIIRLSPEYNPESLPARDYETGLHQHYDRPGYWDDKPSGE
jgi:hypothetical protein